MSDMYFLTREDRSLPATAEQAAIIEFAKGSKDNLLIDALAGAAKTSTLEFLCKYLPLQPMLSIAFNKRIAEEMGKRLPGHVKCATVNSIGHNVWKNAISPRLTLEKDKNYNILKGIVDDLPRRDKADAYEVFAAMRKLVSHAKLSGYVPEETAFSHVKRLVTSDEYWEMVEEADEELAWTRTIVDQALTTSIVQAYKGLIDFDDQIYMPTLFGGTFPNFPITLVDEAQDLSAINHAMLKKLARGRLIAVGDQRQSIYGFRGAVASGMKQLKADFNMTEMTLSVSFRCPIKIVENARFHAPHMQWAPGAAEGSITYLEEWNAQNIPDNAAIICRNNAPLFSLAFKLLRCSRGVKLVGFDIGPSLVKALKKLGPETMTQQELLRAIDQWESEKIAKAGKKGLATIRDKAECLRVFASFGPSLGDAATYVEHLFKTTGTIQLLSGHKSKGLEWETVFHLDPHRIPSTYCSTPEEFEQEKNVKYVIETRAKRDLFMVKLEKFQLD